MRGNTGVTLRCEFFVVGDWLRRRIDCTRQFPSAKSALRKHWLSGARCARRTSAATNLQSRFGQRLARWPEGL